MTDTEVIGDISEMEIIPVEENANKPKYYNKANTKVCPVCGKKFESTPGWAFRKPGKWYCCYTHLEDWGPRASPATRVAWGEGRAVRKRGFRTQDENE